MKAACMRICLRLARYHLANGDTTLAKKAILQYWRTKHDHLSYRR